MNTAETGTRDIILRTALTAIPLALVLLILWLLPRLPEEPHLPITTPTLTAVETDSVESLQARFEAHDYHWPPSSQVPALSVERFPEGLQDLPVEERKSLFFRSLLPLVLAENERILAKREWFQELHETLIDAPDTELSPEDQALVDHLWARYRIDGSLDESDARERLLRRLDIVPPALALAQAANESGWGTSRFTLEANNLFGEWTWDENVGMLPRQRAAGATHFIRVFPSLHGSVRSYVHNLNIGHAYTVLRSMRADIRRQDQTPDGLRLAEGLERYSERGVDYIREVQSMIRQNDLQELPEDLQLEQEP